MKLTVELSMYPLQDDFLPVIQRFIEKLHCYEGLTLSTTATSTLMSGDYARVMESLSEAMAWSHEQQGRAVFVAKFLPGRPE